jgi:hypothetical protein
MTGTPPGRVYASTSAVGDTLILVSASHCIHRYATRTRPQWEKAIWNIKLFQVESFNYNQVCAYFSLREGLLSPSGNPRYPIGHMAEDVQQEGKAALPARLGTRLAHHQNLFRASCAIAAAVL